MKQLLAYLVFAGFLFSFNSCDPNRKCEKITCLAHQVCQNGQCLCPAGFEGDLCNIYSYEKYLGVYQVNENCTPNPGNFYSVTIVKSGSDAQTVAITNMLGLALAAEAYVSGDFLTIPNQKIGAVTISGDGVFNSLTDRIELRYQHDYGNELNTCTSVLIRY